MILVTKPFLPPYKEYETQLRRIWTNNWLTNNGPLVQELEDKLKTYLNVPHLFFVSNGTIALQMAIKALSLKGEIITTPFSFVATASSIVWEGCTPVFVEINKNSFNIDADKIEASITPNTVAILATHVFGNPCEIEKIEEIAKKYHLKVIYDGAHAFDVKYTNKSIFEYGDIATCSLHATKLYHSTEGGLIICKNEQLAQKLKYIRNFGISGFNTFAELGINGKNSEFHAAMGLTNFNYIEKILAKRKSLAEKYDELLVGFPHQKPQWNQHATQNYAYYPILLNSEEELLRIKEKLEKEDIETRRLFYPSLSSALPYLTPKEFPITDDISKRVLSLPFYFDLKMEEVQRIVNIIKEELC